MKYVFLLVLSLSILIAVYQVAAADTPCTPIYGGGLDDKGNPFCMETVQAAPAPTQAPQSGFTTPNGTMQPATTKGGYPVASPSTAKTSPATGPEMLGLFALIPAAMAGWKLRKSATK